MCIDQVHLLESSRAVLFRPWVIGHRYSPMIIDIIFRFPIFVLFLLRKVNSLAFKNQHAVNSFGKTCNSLQAAVIVSHFSLSLAVTILVLQTQGASKNNCAPTVHFCQLMI